MYNIHLLPGSYGDAILIEYGNAEPHYILIDGGPYFVFKDLIAALKPFGIQRLELLVVTHIDCDHIEGIVRLLNQNPLPFEIGEIWFNGFAQLPEDPDLLGEAQGEFLSLLISDLVLPHNTSFQGAAVMVPKGQPWVDIELEGGMKLRLLTPTPAALAALRPDWEEEIAKLGDEDAIRLKLEDDHRYEDIPDLLGEGPIHEDESAANRSSIAFLATYDGKRCLFAADAPTAELLPAVERLCAEEGTPKLNLDAWKLAHHGSKRSTLTTLMEKIDCKQVLVSTDGKRFQHPDLVCIESVAKINGPDVKFYFNYGQAQNSAWAKSLEENTVPLSILYPENAAGISLKL